jgi:hypothetical protein
LQEAQITWLLQVTQQAPRTCSIYSPFFKHFSYQATRIAAEIVPMTPVIAAMIELSIRHPQIHASRLPERPTREKSRPKIFLDYA